MMRGPARRLCWGRLLIGLLLAQRLRCLKTECL